MLAAPQHGFVFLAASKAGSTSVQRALRPYAHLEIRTPPSDKHMPPRRFEAEVAPRLARDGFPRSSYATIAMVRHPLELVTSWWRYRSRPDLDGKDRSTADVTLDEYAEQVMAGEGGFTRPSVWLSDDTGTVLVDRLWRYDHIDALLAWVGDRVGSPLALRRLNQSPERPAELDPGVRRRLEDFFAAELAIYAGAD
ncbi:hypothetical protein [Nocardioides sp. YIM 152315]|uniref:hypothetical protein n=1 Tax=Nocardioides sp. YIM 152315 TaxID=3031760 RepID=UPI0023DB8428|nr:hypothetical protein [Nocardioides sp. YIM 152315]MDF1602674.1 hypothetical protein [Nocardioides sp. YIM 152315]